MNRKFSKEIRGINFSFTEIPYQERMYYTAECVYQNQPYVLRLWFKDDEGRFVPESQSLPALLTEIDIELNDAIMDNMDNPPKGNSPFGD